MQNILLPHDPQHHHPVLIDWEGCTRGLGLWDMARTLVDCRLPPSARRALEAALLSHYHAGLVASGVRHYSMRDTLDDYRLSVLATIPHALVWEDLSFMEFAMQAYKDWDCETLLSP